MGTETISNTVHLDEVSQVFSITSSDQIVSELYDVENKVGFGWGDADTHETPSSVNDLCFKCFCFQKIVRGLVFTNILKVVCFYIDNIKVNHLVYVLECIEAKFLIFKTGYHKLRN